MRLNEAKEQAFSLYRTLIEVFSLLSSAMLTTRWQTRKLFQNNPLFYDDCTYSHALIGQFSLPQSGKTHEFIVYAMRKRARAVNLIKKKIIIITQGVKRQNIFRTLLILKSKTTLPRATLRYCQVKEWKSVLRVNKIWNNIWTEQFGADGVGLLVNRMLFSSSYYVENLTFRDDAKWCM